MPIVLSFAVPFIVAVLWIGRTTGTIDNRVSALEAIERERKGTIKEFYDLKVQVAQLEQRIRALEK